MPKTIHRRARTGGGPPPRRGLSYREAGVDIDAKMSAVSRIGALARKTFSRAVLTEIGSFGGLFDLAKAGVRKPVLASSIDGVGTKLKIAFLMGRHDTVGRDLVNHCVNDILVQGAVPLFFLDYLGTARVEASILEAVISGIVLACEENGCALIGGETAEMPGFYREGEYDLAGCVVGVVEKSDILDGSKIRPGDLILGLRSSGLHTNGFSLARKVLLERLALTPSTYVPALGRSLGEELLEPHRSYLPLLKPWLGTGEIKGMAHITGGGLTDNLPRTLPDGCAAAINPRSWQWPPVFHLIQKGGKVTDAEMRRTFNLGIGMTLVVSREAAVRIRRKMQEKGEPARVIGRIIRGRGQVVFREGIE